MYAKFLRSTLNVTPLEPIVRYAVNDPVAHRQGEQQSLRECGQIMSRLAVDPGNSKLVNVLVITTPWCDATTI